MLLRIRTRFLAAAVLISLAAGSYVRGSQEAAGAGDGQAEATARPEPPRQTLPAPDDARVAQDVAVRKAEAHYEIARQNRILAEIALEEFGITKRREGLDDFAKDKVAIEGKIKQAESDLAQAKDEAELAERLFEKKSISRNQKLSASLKLQMAQYSLEHAISKRDVLEKFMIPKAESLGSKLAKASDEENARLSDWDREKAKKAELERSDEENFKRPKGDGEKTKKTELESHDRKAE